MTNRIAHSFDAIDLEALSDAELAVFARLDVSKEQEDFGGTFLGSVEEWKRVPDSNTYGLAFFIRGRTPAGMVLLKRPPASPSWTPNDAVSLHGLKISREFQGRGLGRFALQLAIEMAKARWPDATKLVLAVDAENVAALTLYRRFGMSDSGPVFEGRVGLEHRLELSLPFKTQASLTP
ncbi:GNAT family N-acetyltransferase [Paracoccus fistulariae]|uniref:GNAT family N-acetyltransferase n=1 Tax=Paracoccus fistulariae TaxID=658446 RepID=A0ABY7SPE3_9RHOB|nr:GNAT family N-acetyltransferase [Paracoccus fistulariae]MDB6182250.1 GNAT family N-acetyltransferase [Paracoccus fistulariae]WCR08763.1 GNAT family N-acetyltransferase [Paracoccus fistulariae]